MRGSQKLPTVIKKDKTQKEITVTSVFLNVTKFLYLSPSDSARSLSTLIAVDIAKDTEHKVSPMIKFALVA